MKKNTIQNTALTAVFIALITGLTLIHLPIPVRGGYVHLGDSIIYLSASFLPFPFAVAAAALGGAFADAVSGFIIWSPFSLVIKALNVLPFAIYEKCKKTAKIITAKSIVLTVASGIITCVFYFSASCIIYGSPAAALTDLPGNAIQAIGSAVIYILIGKALDGSKIKEKFKFVG